MVYRSFQPFADEIGYGKLLTTFDTDFSIADCFGEVSIKDTYNRALEYAKTNYKYLTELVLILNWTLWFHYEKGNQKLAKLYNSLWEKTQNYAFDTLKGDELKYFIHTTD